MKCIKNVYPEIKEFEEVLTNAYDVDMNKRRVLDTVLIEKVIKSFFKILDDIDTAGDIFKPKWNNVTSAVEALHRLRWLYCTIIDNEIVIIDGK